MKLVLVLVVAALLALSLRDPDPVGALTPAPPTDAPWLAEEPRAEAVGPPDTAPLDLRLDGGRADVEGPREVPRAPREVPAATPEPGLDLALDRGRAERPDPPPAAGPVDLVTVHVASQRLDLHSRGRVVRSYPVSTAAAGTGSAAGSYRTPLGRHRVYSVHGEGEPLGRVFRARQPTGEVARIHVDEYDAPEDVITTRILRLEGLEPGLNRGAGVDSLARCIYIHGTNEEGLIGRPASHGCVRMRNADVLEVFELVPVGTPVVIQER